MKLTVVTATFNCLRSGNPSSPDGLRRTDREKLVRCIESVAETERLLINAIALFEIGYFGFAFVLAPGRTLASAAAWGHAALPLAVLLAVELLVLAAMTRPAKVVIERAVMRSNLRVDLI